jgi:hypothetical protein
MDESSTRMRGVVTTTREYRRSEVDRWSWICGHRPGSMLSRGRLSVRVDRLDQAESDAC